MGCEFQMIKSVGIDKNIARIRFKNAQDEDRQENGNSYSGGIGMAEGLEFKNETFEDYSLAKEYLRNTCQKWEAALAVTYKDKEGNLNYLIGAMCSG